MPVNAPTRQTDRHVQSLLAALDLLDAFETRPRMTIREMMAATGMTRNRVMRLAGTLAARGYLAPEAEGANYRLGPRLAVLGRSYERHFDLVQLARPVLRALAEETGESASLYVIDGTERLVLAREETPREVRYTVTEGQRFPLHAGASGKVLLAFGPAALRREVLGREALPALAPGTVVDADRLGEELEQIRKAGVALSRAERSADAASAAAPVFGQRGELVGAVSIAGPVSRLRVARNAPAVARVAAAARELSALLGGSRAQAARSGGHRGGDGNGRDRNGRVKTRAWKQR